MGVEYCLVNLSGREWMSYGHVGGGKRHQLAGDSATAAMTTWYLLNHRGDKIGLVSDEDDDWPFDCPPVDFYDWKDVTEEVVQELISSGILADHGRRYQDPEEENVYMRDLRNVWGAT